MIGQSVAHYRVLEQIGRGGMGVVYKARDERLGRFVALKFLPPEFGEDELAKQRFLREARAASALDHPNICVIHEIGDSGDGRWFIAMAHYEGQTLKERLRQGPLEVRTAADLVAQIADGLAAAHERGIVHRDVKPANVFITDREAVKLLDFGLAKIGGVSKLTRTGTTMGTLFYMPPEQLRGEAVDHRADIWSLGVILYESLTGVLPFAGDAEGIVVHGILSQRPRPPRELRSELPAALDQIVARCLEKNPDARYPSMASLRRELGVLSLDPDRATAAWSAAATAPAAVAPDGESIAVVEFTNITADPAADWLSAGIAETVTADLKKAGSIEVVAGQRVRRALAANDAGAVGERELLDVGARLGVTRVLGGSYQKVGETIRVTAYLIDATRGETLRTLKLDGAMGEIFALQDRILGEMMDSLSLSLSPSARAEVERAKTLDLEAYECCARGRQLIRELRPGAAEEARAYLERAIALDPGYALAYSALGELHAMRFIATTDGSELETAVRHLQRALELDGRLGDPYIWLAYGYGRQHRFAEAIAAGRRAVELEPSQQMSHYMLGVAYWLRAAFDHRPGDLPASARSLARAIPLAPRYQPAHQVLGDVLLRCGQYREARAALERAAEIERSEEFEGARFVGAITLLGLSFDRLGDPERALELYRESLERLAGSSHVYGKAFEAVTHCCRGDVLRRRQLVDGALADYKQAVALAQANPRSLGIGWFKVRGWLGMASVLQRLDMRREAEARHREAMALLESREGFDFSGIWQGGEAEMFALDAGLMAESNRPAEALRSLRRAVELGWRETPRLDADPGLRRLGSEAEIAEIRDALERLEPIELEASRLAGSPA